MRRESFHRVEERRQPTTHLVRGALADRLVSDNAFHAAAALRHDLQCRGTDDRVEQLSVAGNYRWIGSRASIDDLGTAVLDRARFLAADHVPGHGVVPNHDRAIVHIIDLAALETRWACRPAADRLGQYRGVHDVVAGRVALA